MRLAMAGITSFLFFSLLFVSYNPLAITDQDAINIAILQHFEREIDENIPRGDYKLGVVIQRDLDSSHWKLARLEKLRGIPAEVSTIENFLNARTESIVEYSSSSRGSWSNGVIILSNENGQWVIKDSIHFPGLIF
jgi:hypothetical protein